MKEQKNDIIVLALLFVLISFGLIQSVHAYNDNSKEEPQFIAENSEMAGILYATAPNNQTKLFLPLKKTDVHLEITGGIVSAHVTQIFTNDTKHPLEAVYVFPLPSEATVTGMELRIGERIIKSVVKEREEAKKVYNQAKREGKKTALLEQERPNIFTTSVANFLPNETVEIRLSYMETIEYKKGVYSINFPMVVGQRYVPFGVPDAKRINPPLLHPNIDSEHFLSLNADIKGIPVREIISNTHAINIEENESESQNYRISLANKVTIPDSDFNMKIYLAEKSTPQISVLSSRDDDVCYGLITVFPPTEKSETVSMSKDVIFLIDTSGSMSGESISQAKAGLKHCLKMLRPEDNFTIVRFSSGYSYFSPAMRKAESSAISAAKTYIDGLRADGGTNMQQALEYVLKIPKDQESMKIIVFLTDGDVGNENSLMRLLSQQLSDTRLFTFGIGSAPNEYLMRKMAEIGRGQSRFIHSHEDIGEVMADFFKTLETPVLTDINITWSASDGKAAADDIAYYPNPCPDIFHERPLQVFARYPYGFKGTMVISGLLGQENADYEYPLSDLTKSDNYPAIDKMFGRERIDELMYKMIRTNSGTEKENLKKEVIITALTHQLVSKFTSRVAVEERIDKKPDGSLVTVKVPASLPKGWNPSKFFPTKTTTTTTASSSTYVQTATSDYLCLLLGFMAVIAGIFVYRVRVVLEKRMPV